MLTTQHDHLCTNLHGKWQTGNYISCSKALFGKGFLQNRCKHWTELTYSCKQEVSSKYQSSNPSLTALIRNTALLNQTVLLSRRIQLWLCKPCLHLLLPWDLIPLIWTSKWPASTRGGAPPSTSTKKTTWSIRCSRYGNLELHYSEAAFGRLST